MAVYRIAEHLPKIDSSAWVAESATVIGQVEMGPGSSVWFGAVVRGDNDLIRIGARSNVQECAVLHVDAGGKLEIGEDVTIGHQAMLHGCHIGDGSLIGIQSVVLDGARIGRHCLVGAGSLVTGGKAFPDGSLIMGVPAKVVRPLTAEQIEGLRHGAAHYVENARRFRADLVRVD